MSQKPRKGDFGELKSKIFPRGACPQTFLEAENPSVLICSRSTPANCLRMLLQRQHFLLILFRTLNVGVARVGPAASSRLADRHLLAKRSCQQVPGIVF